VTGSVSSCSNLPLHTDAPSVRWLTLSLEDTTMNKLALLLILFPTIAYAEDSLCAPTEQVLFSCSIGKAEKIASLCGSPELKKGSGYLQYRYGVRGKIELVFPATKDNSLEKFRYAHYFRYQIDRAQVSFSNGGFEYSVFTSYDREGKRPVEEHGVLVSKEGPSSKETHLICKSPVSMQLEKLENVLPCDTQSALASCEK
jgi:hypothetical protein